MRTQFIARVALAAVLVAGSVLVATGPAAAADVATAQYGHGLKFRQKYPGGTLRMRIAAPQPVPDRLLAKHRPTDGALRYARVHVACVRGECQLSPFYFYALPATGERYREELGQVKNTVPTTKLAKGDQLVGNVAFDVTHGRIRKIEFTDGLVALAIWQPRA